MNPLRISAGPSTHAGLPSYVFDQRNQLVEARDPVTQAVVGLYTDDVFGRRVRKITASGTTLYSYGSTGSLVEERSLASTPNPVRNYAWIEDEPVGVVGSGPQPTKFSWFQQAGGLNIFSYVSNDPINGVDPNGLIDFGDEINAHVARPRLTSQPYVGIVEAGVNAEKDNFPGESDPHGGGFRHCVSACTARERLGFLGDGLVAAWDCLNENDAIEESRRDMAAEQTGLSIAAGGGNCVTGCLATCPPRPGGSSL